MQSIFEKAGREEILGRIDRLRPASQPRWGEMTVGQMARHCSLCEEYYFGRVAIPRSFLGRLFGQVAIKSLLKNEEAGMRKNSQTAPSLKVTGEIADLDVEKRQWRSLIERYAGYEVETFHHWFFGTMSRQQLGQLIYKHCDHHLRQFGC